MIDLLKIYDLGDAEIVEIELNWAEHVLRILTNPVVTSILLAVAMFGLISEVRTPGWGIGGTLSLVALGLFFGSHLIVHLAEWQELGLFAVGLALLILEVVAIPGFGLVGLAGVGAMLASLVMTQLGDYQLWSIDEIAVVSGRLAASMIGAIVLSVVLLRSLSKFAAFNRLVLQSETPAADGYVSSSREHDVDLVGSEGVSVSDLRPAGIGLIAGERIDVMTDGEFIEAHRVIVVVEARGSRVVVKAL